MVKVSDVGFLLIHGLGSNHLAMQPLERHLTRMGYLVDNIDQFYLV